MTDENEALVQVESTDTATALIARAIDKSVPIETMERLLAMRRELKAEAAKEAFFLALAAFQSECPVIHKDEAVAGKDGKVRYHYAPLEAIVSQVKGILFKHGFSYTLDTEQSEGKLVGICRAHHISGHTEETRLEVPVGSDYMTAQQMVGAARTYATRYAFCNAFGILTGDEDTDARAANGVEGKAAPTKVVSAKASSTPQPAEKSVDRPAPAKAPKVAPAKPGQNQFAGENGVTPTTYWGAVKAEELSHDDGLKILEEQGGDRSRALPIVHSQGQAKRTAEGIPI